MLTKRTFLLTVTGLLAGYVAAAQSTPAPAGPQAVDVLSWVVWWAAGVVLLMAVVTGASVTSAAQRRYTEASAAAGATEPAAPTPAPATAPAQPAFATTRTEEPVAA